MEKNVEDNLNDLSFEDALEELENITENFEDGNSTLEDAVNLNTAGAFKATDIPCGIIGPSVK